MDIKKEMVQIATELDGVIERAFDRGVPCGAIVGPLEIAKVDLINEILAEVEVTQAAETEGE